MNEFDSQKIRPILAHSQTMRRILIHQLRANSFWAIFDMIQGSTGDPNVVDFRATCRMSPPSCNLLADSENAATLNFQGTNGSPEPVWPYFQRTNASPERAPQRLSTGTIRHEAQRLTTKRTSQAPNETTTEHTATTQDMHQSGTKCSD